MTTVAQLNAALTGRYRIERELGGGGMAMVYEARDERHDRFVALKVLRPELAAVIGAERFLNEIKTTANLQHPHILPLHDSGNVDGTVWYVMPSVEGESLRDRLTRETQLPLDDALQITREVASALDYAHRHGVIHRDIKPENILLHDGRAMVADFGIALAVSRTEGGTRITETGMSLGTPHYMSPEQALGERTIDARTDVYALGCVLYEMLAGEPPFTGPSAQAIVAKVMNTAPAPITAVRPTVPSFIESAVQRALNKLPADRFRSAADFAAALQDVGASVTTSGVAHTTGLAATPGSRRKSAMTQVAPWVLAVAALAWAVFTSVRGRAVTDSRVTAAVLPLEIRTNRDAPLNEIGPPISLAPDGSFIVYVGSDPEVPTTTALWKRPLDGLEATVIPGTRGGQWPIVAPDGRSVTYIKRAEGGGRNERWEASMDGGLPIRTRGRRLPGGRELVLTESSFVVRRSSGDELDQSLNPTTFRLFHESSVSPDFKWLAWAPRDSIVVRTPGPGARAAIAAGTSPKFLDKDHLVFRATDGSLQVGRLNADRTRFASAPVPVVPNVLAAGSGGGSFSVGDDGTLAYIAGGATGESRPVWVDAAGREAAIAGLPPRIYGGVSISPAGRRAAVSVGIVGQSTDVWLVDLDLGSMSPITRDGRSSRPSWRRDGRTLNWLHFNTALNRAARRGLTREGAGANLLPAVSMRNVDASAGEDTLPGRWPVLVDELTWSPDEQHLAIRTREIRRDGSQGNRNILVRRLDTDSLVPFAAEPAQERGPVFSADGRWLAYVSDRSGRSEVYVESFPGGGNRVQVSIDGGREAVWSRDGSRIFYRAPDGWMMAATVSPGPTLQVTKRDRLFDASGYHTNEFLSMYDVARDGRFLMLQLESSGARTDVVIIRNWVQSIKSRLAEGR